MLTEPCLLCAGRGRYPQDQACRFCGGTGRVTVQAGGAKVVLRALGSCRVPAKAVTLPPVETPAPSELKEKP